MPILKWDDKTGKNITVSDEAYNNVRESSPDNTPDDIKLIPEVDRMTRDHINETDLDNEDLNPNINPKAKEIYDRMLKHQRIAESAAVSIDDLVEQNYAIYKPVQEAVKGIAKATAKTGVGALDLTFRALNLPVALEVGALSGVAEYLRKGVTPLEISSKMAGGVMGAVADPTIDKNVAEALKENMTYGDLLREQGVPEGPSTKFIPTVRGLGISATSPTSIAWQIADDVIKGVSPIKLIGPKVTSRGVLGFALDNALNPLTYMEFGLPTIAKYADDAKINPNSIIRFMNKTLLEDEDLVKGIKWLRNSKAGQAVEEFIDNVVAAHPIIQKVGANSVKMLDEIHALFSTKAKVYDPDAVATANAYTRHIYNNASKIVATKAKYAKLTDEQKAEFVDKLVAGFNEEKLAKDIIRRLQVDEGLDKLALESAKAYTRPTFKDKILNDLYDEFIGEKGWLSVLSKQAGLPEWLMYHHYFPFILKELKDPKASGFKSIRARMSLPEAPYFKARKSTEIGERFVSDPIEALTTRALELNNRAGIKTFIEKILKTKGKQFATRDEAIEAGFKEFTSELNKSYRLFKQGSYTAEGDLFDKTIAKGAKELGEKAVTKVEKVYVPEKTLRSLEDWAGKNWKPSSEFWRNILGAIDSYTHINKAFLTSPFPAFHTRNLVANRLQRFANEGFRAFRLGDDAVALRVLGNHPELDSKLITLKGGASSGGKTRTFPERVIRKWAEHDMSLQLTSVDADYGSRMLSTVEEPSTSIFKKFNDAVEKNGLIKAGRDLGMFIENQAKVASYVAALRDGYSRKQAAEIARQGLFDYSQGTAFEKQVMSRIFPFYKFTRKNLELQMKTILTRPGRANAYLNLIKEIQGESTAGLTAQQKEAFLQYKDKFLNDGFAFPVGIDEKDNISWVMGFGMPQEESFRLLNNPGATTLFAVNPLLKVPAIMAGVDLRALGNGRVAPIKDTYEIRELRPLYKGVLNETKFGNDIEKVINSKEFQENPITQFLFPKLKVVTQDEYDNKGVKTQVKVLVADGKALSLIRNSIISRFLTITNKYDDANYDKSNLYTRIFTGLNVYKQTVEKALRYGEAQRRADVGQALETGKVGYSTPLIIAKDPLVKRSVRTLNKSKEQI